MADVDADALRCGMTPEVLFGTIEDVLNVGVIDVLDITLFKLLELRRLLRATGPVVLIFVAYLISCRFGVSNGHVFGNGDR